MSDRRPEPAVRDARYRAAAAAAAVSAVFSLVVCGLLVSSFLTVPYAAPIDSPEMAALRAALQKEPANEPLKGRIRELDLALRRDFFRRHGFSETGAWLLLAGAIAAVASLRLAAAARKRPPMPPGTATWLDDEGRPSRLARRAVVAAGLLVAGTALGFAVSSISILPGAPTPAGVGPAAGPVEPPPAAADFAANWPMFRGPGGIGRIAGDGVPTDWDGASGRNVLWKTPILRRGKGSPVAWGDRVYLAGGDKDVREVFAFDAATGKPLWRGEVKTPPGRPVPAIKDEKEMDPGYAASTPATDGRRVFAIFATGDVGCFGADGKPLWTRSLGAPTNPYGHAASLAVAPGLVFVQVDQGTDEEGTSRLHAFDAATGRPAWQAKRPVGASWSTPIPAEIAGRPQLVTSGHPWLIAYAPADGKELWRAKCQSGEVAPSPVVSGGIVFAVNPNESLAAVRADGQGDVTKTHVAWKAEDGIPDICSPATDGARVYVLTTQGTLTCYGAADGKKKWEHEYETDCFASPTVVGDRLLLLTAKGTAIWVAAADAFRELGRAELGEGVFASPAFLGGRIYLRGTTHLYSIGAKAP
jgi:outer membrane protein assembly factor BamB